ncbi:DNA primase, partial [Butyricicoccus sp. 1XD8-22]
MSNKYSAHEWLEKYYHHVLMNTEVGVNARNYLLSRGISKDTMKELQLGFSPSDVRPTLGFLKAKGFSFNDLVDNKILTRYQSGKYK